MPEIGRIISGRYKVTGFLSHGGMSMIYHAEDLRTGKHLVIKEAIKRQTKDDQIMEQGLVIEGKLLKKMNNPHLPKIYDVIEEADQIMIIMDYVEGKSLDAVLAENGAIRSEQVIEWAIQICDLYHYLHTQSPPIIYRDMKPANVILQPSGMIKMIDFGTARTFKGDADRTSDTILIGTEGFAAPEQYGGCGESDARTDIFCLGATMFNLVTNHSPYIQPYGITPLGYWNQALSECALDKIIQKCTANDPDLRYQNAMELKDALKDARLYPSGQKSGLKKLFTKKLNESQGWKSPDMKASDGRSMELIKKEQKKVTEKFSPLQGNHVAGMYEGRLYDDTSPQITYKIHDAVKMKESQKKSAERPGEVWKWPALISLIASMCLLIPGIVLIALGNNMEMAGIICLIFAAASMVLGIVGAIFYLRT